MKAGGSLWEPIATLMIGGLGLASVLTLSMSGKGNCYDCECAIAA